MVFFDADTSDCFGCLNNKCERHEGDTYLMPLICAMLWWEILDRAEIT